MVCRHHTQGLKVSGRRITNPNAGFPDITAIRDGQTHYFEVKTSTGKVSEVQKEWHKRAYEHGVVVHVVTSIDEVAEIIDFWYLKD